MANSAPKHDPDYRIGSHLYLLVERLHMFCLHSVSVLVTNTYSSFGLGIHDFYELFEECRTLNDSWLRYKAIYMTHYNTNEQYNTRYIDGDVLYASQPAGWVTPLQLGQTAHSILTRFISALDRHPTIKAKMTMAYINNILDNVNDWLNTRYPNWYATYGVNIMGEETSRKKTNGFINHYIKVPIGNGQVKPKKQ